MVGKEQDGVITLCEKCKEPIKILKDGYEFNTDCRCEEKRRWDIKNKKYKNLSLFDKDSEENNFENAIIVDEKERAYVLSFKKFCDNFDLVKKRGLGMILKGNAGTGKTYYQTCIYNELKEKHNIINLNVSKYFAEIKTSEKWDLKERELLNLVEKSDLLMVDDLGSEQISDKWGKEKIYNLIDTAYRKKISLVISTNTNTEQLRELLMFNSSDKIMDRILEICKPFNFNWKSRRAGKNKEYFEKYY